MNTCAHERELDIKIVMFKSTRAQQVKMFLELMA